MFIGFRALTTLCLTGALGCSAPIESAGEAAATATDSASSEQRGRIEHLMPAPDSTVGAPSRFEWSRVDGADYYDLVVMTEIDGLVWRQTRLREPSAVWPKDRELEPGTYFWMVGAIRDNRPIAESGRAAFVVHTP
jgi:hypothetical protein